MSNTSTGSAGPTPPPVRFPDTKGEVAHRWGAGTVAVLIGVVVLVAAVVVAAIVFSGGPSKPRPVPTVPSQFLTPAPTNPAPQSNTHGSQFGFQALDYHSTVAKPSTPVFLASGTGAVEIGDGMSMDLAKGWTVADNGENYAIVLNRDTTAELFVGSGKVSGADVMSVLESDINNLITGPNAVLSNVKIGKPDQKTVSSKNFQQEAAVAYAADMSMQQGTMPVYGVFLELMNTKTQEAVFFDLHAISTDALDTAATDADQMINSLL